MNSAWLRFRWKLRGNKNLKEVKVSHKKSQCMYIFYERQLLMKIVLIGKCWSNRLNFVNNCWTWFQEASEASIIACLINKNCSLSNVRPPKNRFNWASLIKVTLPKSPFNWLSLIMLHPQQITWITFWKFFSKCRCYSNIIAMETAQTSRSTGT